MLFGGTKSGTNLAMAKSASEKKNAIFINIGAATSALTNEQCNALHRPLGLRHRTCWPGAPVRRWSNGAAKTWFFLTADYAFGPRWKIPPRWSGSRAARWSAASSIRSPPDFSSFLLQAQASKAQIIGLANAGGDTINSIKAARSSASPRHEAGRPAGLHHRRALAGPEDHQACT